MILTVHPNIRGKCLILESNVPTDPPYYVWIVLSSTPLAPEVRLKKQKIALCSISMSCAIKNLIISLLDMKDWTTFFKEKVTMAPHIIKPFGSNCHELRENPKLRMALTGQTVHSRSFCTLKLTRR